MEITKNGYIEHCREKVEKYKILGLGPKETYEKVIEELANERLPILINYYKIRNYYYKSAPKIRIL